MDGRWSTAIRFFCRRREGNYEICKEVSLRFFKLNGYNNVRATTKTAPQMAIYNEIWECVNFSVKGKLRLRIKE